MKRRHQWFILVFALLIIGGTYLYITQALETQKNTVRKARPPAPEASIDVSVLTVEPGQYAATIQASGIASPHYELTLSTQVNGEVLTLENSFEKGQRVKKGQRLATLYNSELTSTLANAQNTLASAILALKEEQQQAQQSKEEWKSAGFKGEPESDLVLRKPQLEAALAQVNAAKASLAAAKSDLLHTKLTAPFDALITARFISPGSYLNAGSDIATLYSTDRIEISLDLSNSEWLKLPDAKSLLSQAWPAQIDAIDGSTSWLGKVLSIDMHINNITRLRGLVISLAHPLDQSPPLLPGAFVTVNLKGKVIDNLWRLPNSALSQKSEIWYITEENRLGSFETTPRFVDAQYVYIDVPDTMRKTPHQILVQPYNSYLQGMLVNPQNIASVTNGAQQ